MIDDEMDFMYWNVIKQEYMPPDLRYDWSPRKCNIPHFFDEFRMTFMDLEVVLTICQYLKPKIKTEDGWNEAWL